MGSILKTNVRACKAVGHPFVIQLGRIYLDMLNVYKCLSENISAAIQANGKNDYFNYNNILDLFTWLFIMWIKWTRLYNVKEKQNKS